MGIKMRDKKKYKLTKYCKEIQKNNRVILYHELFGETIQISLECWKIIKDNLDRGYDIQDIYQALEEEDKDYFEMLFSVLIKKRMLIGKEEEELANTVREIDLSITHRCNLTCVHCCVDATTEKEEEYLKTDELIELIDSISKLPLEMITISGGEPMVRADFFRLSRYLKKKFSGKLSLMTNGMLINENNVEELVSIYDTYDISIDGYDEESCSRIRGKGVFKRVLQSVELLKEHGVLSENISLSMVETRLNYDEQGMFYKLNEELGTKPLVREFSAIGRGKEAEERLKLDRLDDWAKLNPQDSLLTRTCSAGIRRLAINYDGVIYPCMLLDYEEYQLGNIRHIKDMYNYIKEERYKQTVGFQNLLQLMPENHEKCSGCEYNMFCFYCLQEIYENIKNKELDSYCSAVKEGLGSVWK